MPGNRITELPSNTAPVTTDVLPIFDIGGTVDQKITIANLLTLFVTNVTVQVLVASGTYTPTTGMKKCLAICVGGGGGGASGTNTDSAGGGGGGGGCAIKLLTSADIGASKAFHIGAAGAAEGNGGITHIGADGSELVNATGGTAGTAGAGSTTIGTQAAGGAGGVGTVGDLLIAGSPGGCGLIYSTAEGVGGKGGNSFFGTGGAASATNTDGVAGSGYGGGGGGGHASSSTNEYGAAGSIGVIYVIEFLG